MEEPGTLELEVPIENKSQTQAGPNSKPRLKEAQGWGRGVAGVSQIHCLPLTHFLLIISQLLKKSS